MRWLEIALLWEGIIALGVIIGTYFTQAWYKEHLGRFILALMGALFSAYLPSVIRSVSNQAAFKVSITSLTYLSIFAILLTYGAFAFIYSIRKRKMATEQIDEWTNDVKQ